MYNKDKRYRNTSNLPGNINNIPINRLNDISEKSCIILSFSKSAYNFIETIIIKAHILFGKRKPEIYMNPNRKVYGISLHYNCYICRFWLTHCIEGSKQSIYKLSNILNEKKNPILLFFSPYLYQMVICSEISDKDAINKSIIKRIMPIPINENIFISARIDINRNKDKVINVFKKITKYSWFNMFINKSAFAARCSIFMNFVNENDIFNITDIFPREIYQHIFKICNIIWNKNYILFPKNNSDSSNEETVNNNKENNIIELSEDEKESDLILENPIALNKKNDEINNSY